VSIFVLLRKYKFSGCLLGLLLLINPFSVRYNYGYVDVLINNADIIAEETIIVVSRLAAAAVALFSFNEVTNCVKEMVQEKHLNSQTISSNYQEPIYPTPSLQHPSFQDKVTPQETPVSTQQKVQVSSHTSSKASAPPLLKSSYAYARPATVPITTSRAYVRTDARAISIPKEATITHSKVATNARILDATVPLSVPLSTQTQAAANAPSVGFKDISTSVPIPPLPLILPKPATVAGLGKVALGLGAFGLIVGVSYVVTEALDALCDRIDSQYYEDLLFDRQLYHQAALWQQQKVLVQRCLDDIYAVADSGKSLDERCKAALNLNTYAIKGSVGRELITLIEDINSIYFDKKGNLRSLAQNAKECVRVKNHILNFFKRVACSPQHLAKYLEQAAQRNVPLVDKHKIE
jgi:hypothetical protein